MPLILGMDFLVKASPFVNWKEGRVTCYVGTKKYILPTCNISSISSINDDNSFAGLEVDDNNDNSEHELSHSNNMSNIINDLATESSS